ncbi:MAG: CDGSH iron-sulfur domain-containing protein [Thermoleophilia bacterium]|nr:CDGSH iron-sulfur domain-containing protein [Thermoleophilia bacterium]
MSHGNISKNPEDVTITVRPNGPYVITGTVKVIDTDGNPYEEREVIKLCRCGASKTKPFCDGEHSRIGFAAAEQAVADSERDNAGA